MRVMPPRYAGWPPIARPRVDLPLPPLRLHVPSGRDRCRVAVRSASVWQLVDAGSSLDESAHHGSRDVSVEQSAHASGEGGRMAMLAACREAALMRARSAERKRSAGSPPSDCCCWLPPTLCALRAKPVSCGTRCARVRLPFDVGPRAVQRAHLARCTCCSRSESVAWTDAAVRCTARRVWERMTGIPRF